MFAINLKKNTGEVSLAFTAREDIEIAGSTARIRLMNEVDLEHILKFRTVVSWSADPRAFELLRGIKEARWAVAEAASGALVGMVGAVPLGDIGILCHLAVHHDYRKAGLGAALASWAVSYLRSKGVMVVRLDSTVEAEKLYRSLGFKPVSRRFVYRLEGRYRGMQPPENAYRVSPFVVGDLSEVYGLDRWSFGADRSALILAPLRIHPGWGLVVRDASGLICGYLVRSASEGGTRLGPFMASTYGAACALLAHSLDTRRKPRKAPIDPGRAYVEVVVPVEETPAHELFDEFGFVGREDRLRMELGEVSSARGLQTYGTTPYLAT